MKTIAQIVLLVFPLVFFAQQNPSKSFTESIALDASAEKAWSAITDFSTFKSWDSNVVAVRCPESVKKSQVCQMISKTGEVINVEIVDLVENSSYTIRYKLSSGNFYVQRSLSTEDKPTLTETAWFTGISKKTFEKYKGSDYGAFMKQRVQNFKKFVEEGITAEGLQK